MREWGYFLFFASFFCLYFFSSIYVAWRINAGLNIRRPHNFLIYAAATVMSVISTSAYVFSKYNIDPFAHYLSPAGGIWMGIAGISSVIFLANDLLNFAIRRFNIKNFRRRSTLVSLILAAALCIWSYVNASAVLKIKEISIKAPQLQTDKLSVALLSDMHIDKHTSAKSVRKIVDIVNSFDCDIIALTGDLSDNIDISETYAEYALDKLHAKYGIFAVTGNHEYYTGIEKYEKLCEKLGFKLLRNANMNVEGIITVAGINDKQGARQKTDTVDIEAALSGIENNEFVLFLSHRPETFDIASRQGINIMQLSGHTHAGQILPGEMLIRGLTKYSWGLYGHKDSQMYVTSGNRWWRAPMRTFNTSEIVVIKMYRGADA